MRGDQSDFHRKQSPRCVSDRLHLPVSVGKGMLSPGTLGKCQTVLQSSLTSDEG